MAGSGGRVLSLAAKVGLYRLLTAGAAPQTELAARFGVDRSTVARIRRVGDEAIAAAFAAQRPGRPARAAPSEAQQAARAELESLSELVQRQTALVRLLRGRAQLDLPAGPLPARVDAATKQRLIELVDEAAAHGVGGMEACRELRLDPTRLWRWRQRAAAGQLADAHERTGLHGLLPEEEEAILTLAREWGAIDRSTRRLAHRGSYLERVWVSPSTIKRVLDAHDVRLPPPLPPIPPLRLPLAGRTETTSRAHLWTVDVSRVERTGTTVIAIVDTASHAWLATAVTDGQPAAGGWLALAVAAHDVSRTPGPSAPPHVIIAPSQHTIALFGDGPFNGDGPLDSDALADSEDRRDTGPHRWTHPHPAARTATFVAGDGLPQRTAASDLSMRGSPDPTVLILPADAGEATGPQRIPSPLGYVRATNGGIGSSPSPDLIIDDLERARHHYNHERLDPALGYMTAHDARRGRAAQVHAAREHGLRRARMQRAHTRTPPQTLTHRNQPEGHRPWLTMDDAAGWRRDP